MRTVLMFEGEEFELKPVEEHRLNYGRLSPGKTYKADCTCGWSFEGTKDETRAAVKEHEKLI